MKGRQKAGVPTVFSIAYVAALKYQRNLNQESPLPMRPVWIVAAKRTPQGKFLGSLSKRTAVDLGVAAAKAALEGIDPARVDLVVVGNVLGAGQGMNVARQ